MFYRIYPKFIQFFLLMSLLFVPIWESAAAPSVTKVTEWDVWAGKILTDYPNYHYMLKEDKGDATTESTALTAYIPIANDTPTNCTTDNRCSSYLTDPSKMPSFTLGGHIVLDVAVTNTDSDPRYLKAAVQDPNDNDKYTLIALSNWADLEIPANQTSTEYLIKIDLDNTLTDGICDIVSPVCANEDTFELIVYVFLSTFDYHDEHVGDPDGITPSGSTGIYYKLKFSKALPDKAPTLSNLLKGDERVTAQYTGFSIDEKYKLLTRVSVTDFGSLYLNNPSSFSRVSTSIQEKDFDAAGEVTITQLTNNTQYYVSLAYMDKYLFTSLFSNSLAQTPEDIEVFLEGQACYLLSAGFKTDHYVLRYFRNFRDEVLQNYSLGRAFVSWYYNTAPKYGQIIYENRILSFLMRGVGYVAYTIMQYGLIILPLLMISIFIIFRRRYLNI